MSNTKRKQAVEAIGEEKVKALENAFEIWLKAWISTADKTMENCFPYDYFTNYLGSDQNRSIYRTPYAN